MNERHSGGFNRKLLGGLALVIGIGVVIAALSGDTGAGVLSFLPYLLILACPLMMLFMMGSMGAVGHPHASAPDGQQGSVSDTMSDLRGLSCDEQVRVLRGELTRMAWRQEAPVLVGSYVLDMRGHR